MAPAAELHLHALLTSAVYGVQLQLNYRSLICIHLYVALVHDSYCMMHVA